jgi:hypothetical protein
VKGPPLHEAEIRPLIPHAQTYGVDAQYVSGLVIVAGCWFRGGAGGGQSRLADDCCALHWFMHAHSSLLFQQCMIPMLLMTLFHRLFLELGSWAHSWLEPKSVHNRLLFCSCCKLMHGEYHKMFPLTLLTLLTNAIDRLSMLRILDANFGTVWIGSWLNADLCGTRCGLARAVSNLGFW